MYKDNNKNDIIFEDITEVKTITYKLDKKEFIVQPMYKINRDKTINDMLLSLMIKDSDNY